MDSKSLTSLWGLINPLTPPSPREALPQGAKGEKENIIRRQELNSANDLGSDGFNRQYD
jgi:hypothetical protein